MEHSANLRKIAQELKAVQDRSGQIEPFSSSVENFVIEDAYIVADLIHKMRMENGETPIGRKIGFTNPEVCSLYGVNEPIWGHVYDSTVYFHKDPQSSYGLSRFTEPKIEPEIIVHFHSSPQAGADLADILECIDWIAHGFEIVQSHFPGWKFQASDTVADCGLHAMLIIGEPIPIAQFGQRVLSDLESFTIALSCNDQELDQGKGSNALGNPINAVMHLIDVLSRQPHLPQLRANELVTTGTLTAALPVKNDQRWSTTVAGIALPGISISFGA